MDQNKVQNFREAVIEEIEKLGKEPVDPDELQKVKTMLKADYQFSNETNANIAYTFGHFNTLGMLEHAICYEQMITEVTAQDVKRYALKVLSPDSYTIGVVNPRMPADKEVKGE